MTTSLSKEQLEEIVTITCYRMTEKLKRREAIEIYQEGAYTCEGSEAGRYMNIYFQLLAGDMVCSDTFMDEV